MLPLVIYITNGIITGWGNLLIHLLGGSIDLAQVVLHSIWICGLELHSICFKKCIHAMAIGYFLEYIAYYSWPDITALVPICSLCGYLAGVIIYLYLLATKLFTIFASWCQSCCCLSLLAPNPLFSHSTKGCCGERSYCNQFFTLSLHYFWMVPI